MALRDSLTYNPVELSFGTSGLRGLVSDMTDLECFINAAGFIEFLAKNDGLQLGSKIFLAGDLRDSTPRIMQVMTAAIIAAGFEPVNCGKIPTPALANYALSHSAPCIMVTGSHIPADRNGIKFYKSSGEILKSDEAAMQQYVALTRSEIYNADESLFTVDGALKSLPELPVLDPEAETVYLKRYTNIFAADSLAGKKVVVYQHSAVGRDVIVTLLESLGAEVVSVGRTDIFVSIDTENVREKEKALFNEFVAQNPGAFAVVSTDGDSDRPFVIDETGEFHRGDVLGCVVADFLGAQSAAVPVSSNDAIDIFCAKKGIALEHTRIGSPYVIDAMTTATARPSVSWEVNGGFLTIDDISLGNGTLSALPTRDAVLPILAALLSAAQTNQKVSEVFAALPARYTGGGLVDVAEDQIARYRAVSNDLDAMQSLADRVFSDAGLGAVKQLNTTDGLRLIFENGDVIHLRPSGNAPQFRVYTNTATQNYADELADRALAPNGYIAKLLDLLA